MVCSYHYFLFTPFVSDVHARYLCGYSLIVSATTNIASNVLLGLAVSLLILARKIKLYKLKTQQKQKIKKRALEVK